MPLVQVHATLHAHHGHAPTRPKQRLPACPCDRRRGHVRQVAVGDLDEVVEAIGEGAQPAAQHHPDDRLDADPLADGEDAVVEESGDGGGRRSARWTWAISARLQLVDESLADEAGGIAGDVAAVAGDLADEGGADEAVLGAGGQEDRVDVGLQVGVRVGDLQLVLEVRGGAQPAHDDACLLVLAELDEQTVERLHGHVGQVGGDSRDEVEPLLDGEQGAARGVAADADDDVAEERGRALDEIEVAQRGGVEAPRVDGQACDRSAHRELGGKAAPEGGAAGAAPGRPPVQARGMPEECLGAEMAASWGRAAWGRARST